MFFQTIVASIIGSVFALVGGVVLLLKEDLARKLSLFLVSFAAGSLIGAAFFELIPEALDGAAYERVAPFMVLGILVIFIFEKTLNWYHCHDQGTCDYHSFSSTVLFGDAVHNFIDGIIIALSFRAGIHVGVAATLAIFFHEVPQEIGDFGVLLHAGYKRSKVFLYNFLTALTTPIGAVVGYFLLPWVSGFTPMLLTFAAGTFVYIAVSDLFPELRHEGRGVEAGHVLTIISGIFIVWAVGEFLPE